ncbi:MAG: gliding motility-associated lipoprotein GldH [Candidatus Latescibacterota bacterium]|jgi:gliding motility-associated lipoprotein GldH
MPKYIAIILLSIILGSCDSNVIWSESKSISNGFWSKDTVINFSLPEVDSTAVYNVFLTVRNTNNFKFNNLYVIVAMEHPFGKKVTDTIEYRLANPDGTWLGTGMGSVKENKLWFKEGFHFKESGNYNISITHAMRNNGEADGVSNLEGITDVGFSIEAIDQE